MTQKFLGTRSSSSSPILKLVTPCAELKVSSSPLWPMYACYSCGCVCAIQASQVIATPSRPGRPNPGNSEGSDAVFEMSLGFDALLPPLGFYDYCKGTTLGQVGSVVFGVLLCCFWHQKLAE